MMEWWVFKGNHIVKNLLEQRGYTILAVLQYLKTHFSNIPAFQYSKRGEAPSLFFLRIHSGVNICQQNLFILMNDQFLSSANSGFMRRIF
jgi:hypothetical protein